MTELIARSLLHFLWEGTLVGLLAALLLKAMRRSRPQLRYTAACAMFLVMAAAPLLTLAFLSGSPSSTTRTVLGTASPGIIELAAGPNQQPDSWLPAVFATWLAGVSFFSVRAAGGWLWAVKRLRSGRTLAGPALRDTAVQLAANFAIRRAVRVFESVTAAVPTTYGAIRPVVLLPASALTGLAPAQLEAILAHELAHIARHDFLVNCLQTAVETLLFYQPAVWWLSRVIRQEREVCCDLMAAEVCGDRVEYSRALLTLEELRHLPNPALAATGGDLRTRVERLLVPNAPDRSAFLSAMLILTAVLAGGAAVTLRAQQQPAPSPGAWQRWLQEDVVYIIKPEEREAFNRLSTDEERQRFITQFWEVRGGKPAKEEHYRRIAYTDKWFHSGGPGWTTDRGRLYIVHGPPAEIESHPSDYRESWRYTDGRQFDFAGPEYMLQAQRPGAKEPAATRPASAETKSVQPEAPQLPNEPTPLLGRPLIEPQPGQIFLQVSAIMEPEAEIVVEALHRKGFNAVLASGPQPNIMRVLVGPVAEDDLVKTRSALENAGFRPISRRY